MTPPEITAMLSEPLEIEEKIDGANLGISLNARGEIQFQNRGNWLEGKFSGQWERLRGWAASHVGALRAHLPADHVLFGEWCYAKHSIFYDHLPDWFVAFDVYDRNLQRFWSSARRNVLLKDLQISAVPSLGTGRFTVEQLTQISEGQSAFSKQVREGIYLRRENEDWLLQRAKIVCPGFVQQIGEHWASRAIQINRVVGVS